MQFAKLFQAHRIDNLSGLPEISGRIGGADPTSAEDQGVIFSKDEVQNTAVMKPGHFILLGGR